jgi:hypothetical protein
MVKVPVNIDSLDAFVALTVKLYVPVVVGVPEITPVLGPSVIPSGKAPLCIAYPTALLAETASE